MNLSSSAAILEAPGRTRTPHPPHLPDLRLQLAGVGALGAAAGGTVFRVHTSGGRPLGGSLCRQVLHWEWSADLPTPAACVCVTPVRTAGRATVDMGFMPRLASLSWIWALPQPPRGGCAQRGTGARWGLLPQGPPGRAALAGPIPAAGRASCPPPHLPRRIPSALDNSLLHAIETIIIDWSHQIRDVLSKDSAQPLLDGLHPLPRVEFEFWDARLMNLKYIHEQVTVSPPCRGDPVSVALQPRAHGPARTIPKPCSPLRGPPGRWRGPREPARGSPGLQRPWGKASFAWGLRVPLERLMFLFSVSAEQAQSEQNS